MAEPGHTPDPNPQGGAGDGGDKTKLYAGKFKTIEEMETAHKELERQWHEERQANSSIRQEVGEIRSILESGGYGQGGRREDYTPAATDPNVNTKVLQELYQNPVGVLQAVKESAKKELREELTRDEQLQRRNAHIVSQWVERNPDVSSYPDLLGFYVQQTDARLTPDKRLDAAAEAVRKRVVELRQGRQPNAGPNPGDHIEPPSGGSAGGQTPTAPATPQPGDPERELAQFVAKHNATARRPLSSHKVAAA